MGNIKIIKHIPALRTTISTWRKNGMRIGFVPTMGALHAGHQSLIAAAANTCDRVIVSIFINPTQFGTNEDFNSYPQTLNSDCDKVTKAGGHVIFAPTIAEIYPKEFATTVSVIGLSDVLCGASRPGHFNGVTQIVAKLLNQTQADYAFFGEKDWQQLTIIKRMTLDLDIPTTIIGVPTQRDTYGLALSSRNKYLSKEQINIARCFNVILRKAAYNIASGASSDTECKKAHAAIINAGFDAVDYVECRDANTLASVEKMTPTASWRIYAAAYLGKARLIDNHKVTKKN